MASKSNMQDMNKHPFSNTGDEINLVNSQILDQTYENMLKEDSKT